MQHYLIKPIGSFASQRSLPYQAQWGVVACGRWFGRNGGGVSSKPVMHTCKVCHSRHRVHVYPSLVQAVTSACGYLKVHGLKMKGANSPDPDPDPHPGAGAGAFVLSFALGWR